MIEAPVNSSLKNSKIFYHFDLILLNFENDE